MDDVLNTCYNTILSAIFNMNSWGGGGATCPFNEHKNVHFDNQ